MRRTITATALTLGLTMTGAVPASAAAGEWPLYEEWQSCADAAAQFCVETASVTPDGGTETPFADLGLSASVFTDEGWLRWDVAGLHEAPQPVLDGRVTLRLRLGGFEPSYTRAQARGLRMLHALDDDGNATVTITGSPVRYAERDRCDEEEVMCEVYDTVADESSTAWVFQGDADVRPASTSGGSEWVAGDVRVPSEPGVTVTDNGYPYWQVSLFRPGPTLDTAGEPLHGAVSLFVPEAHFAGLGTTAADAVAEGLDVTGTRILPLGLGLPVETSLPIEVELLDGGVAIDVTDRGYAVEEMRVYARPSDFAPGTTAPGVPGAITATSVAGGVKVTWAAPADDGGRPVVEYAARLWRTATGGFTNAECRTDEEQRGCTVEAEQPADSWITVSAVNAFHQSVSSARVPVTTGVAPSAPRSVVAVPGNGSVTLKWTAPAAPGSHPITGYTVQAYQTAAGPAVPKTCASSAAARTCTINGLSNGTALYFGVTATSAAGRGASAAAVRAVPLGPPAAPARVKAAAAAKRLTVTWSAPGVTGGTPITGYRATAWTSATGSAQAATCTAKAAARSCTTGTLVAGRTYWVSVTATNAAGTSPATARVRVQAR